MVDSNKEIKQDLSISSMQNYVDQYNKSQQEDLSQQVEGDFILDTRNLDSQEIDVKKFKKGIDEYSPIAGKMSALTSMGIESKVALEFIERELIREHELKMLKLKNDKE